MKRIAQWFRPRLRLWSIYQQLGYHPWRKPRPQKQKKSKGVYIGTREAIPFMNEDAKRTLSHLLLRPGYMMRDYILRGQHERYLAPFTALLVFYSVFTLLVAVVKPQAPKDEFGDSIIRGFGDATVSVHQADSLSAKDEFSSRAVLSILETMKDAVLFTRMDLHPEMADTPWKESLAAVEGDLRSKGIPLFLGSFLLLWLAMATQLKKYKISFSGAAAASAYVLCQYCIFMFLALVFSFGGSSKLGLAVMGILLLVDYYQLLGVNWKTALKHTIKTGIIYLLILILFYVFLAGALVAFAIYRI